MGEMFFAFVLAYQFLLGTCVPTGGQVYSAPNCTQVVTPNFDHAGNPLPKWFTDLQKRKSGALDMLNENKEEYDPTRPPPPPPALIEDRSCPHDVNACHKSEPGKDEEAGERPWLSNGLPELIKVTGDELTKTCQVIHERYRGRGYFFSWKDLRSSRLKLNWDSAVRFCKARCMELVSIETKHENDFLDRNIMKGGVSNVWTSGRKCDFQGCNDPSLHPLDVYGWFWEGSRTQLPPTTDLFDSNWSPTGELGKPQPDNSAKHHGGENESCLAIRNNAFNDGIRWHDEVCSKRMSVICEEKRRTEQWPQTNDHHQFYYYTNA